MAAGRPTTEGARRLRVIALLVLVGVLAALTARSGWSLAAWTAAERSAADFRSGIFWSQSQADGTDWAAHPVGSAVSLSATDVTGLAPGGTLEAPTAGEPVLLWLNLRTGLVSTWSGRVQLVESTGSSTLAPALEYRVVSRAASTTACTSADLDAGTDLAGSSPDWVPVGTVSTEGERLALGASQSAPLGLCVAVRVAASAAGAAGSGYQGTSADLTWTFTVTQDG
jgi:hypothetical protein